MTYVGQQPATTFDSGIQDRFTGLTTNTVTLNHEISAEEDILVVWNNIVQDKNTYSVGGTGNKTVTLGGTLVSADVVTVYYLNKVMQSVNPTAGSVTTATINDTAVTGAKLNDDVISSQTAITSVADTDELLVSDAGVLKRIDYSHIKGSAFANVQYSCGMWKQTAIGIADSTWTKWNTTSGTELWDKGNIMDLSNSRITVPSDAAGVWVFKCAVKNENYASPRMLIRFYKNGSDTEALGGTQEIGPLASGSYTTCQIVHFFSLAAGDYIEPYVYQASGSTNNMYDFFYSASYLGVAS